MKQAVWILMTLALGRAEIIDGVVAVVGREVVLQSDLDREGRLEAFFGAATPVPAQVLERLLRQRLLFQEMEQTAPPEVSPAQARKWIEQMRPADKDPSRQGLREADLVEYAGRQLQVERFVDQRFKTDLQVTPQEIDEYYQKRLRPELERQGVVDIPPLEKIQARVEQAAREEKANQALDEWLAESRQRSVRILEKEKP